MIFGDSRSGPSDLEVGGKKRRIKIFSFLKRSAPKVEQSYFAKRFLSPANCGTIISGCILDAFLETELI